MSNFQTDKDMRKLFYLPLTMLIMSLTVMVGCKRDNPTAPDVAEVVQEVEEAPLYDTVYFTKVITKVNFRKEPKGAAEIIRKLQKGDTVKFVNKNDTAKNELWIQVEFMSDTGYVSRQYLSDSIWSDTVRVEMHPRETTAEEKSQQFDSIAKEASKDSAMHYILWQKKIVGVIVVQDTELVAGKQISTDSLSDPNTIRKIDRAMIDQLQEKQPEFHYISDGVAWIIGIVAFLLGIILTYGILFVMQVNHQRRKAKMIRQEINLEVKEVSEDEERDDFMCKLIIKENEL